MTREKEEAKIFLLFLIIILIIFSCFYIVINNNTRTGENECQNNHYQIETKREYINICTLDNIQDISEKLTASKMIETKKCDYVKTEESVIFINNSTVVVKKIR